MVPENLSGRIRKKKLWAKRGAHSPKREERGRRGYMAHELDARHPVGSRGMPGWTRTIVAKEEEADDKALPMRCLVCFSTIRQSPVCENGEKHYARPYPFTCEECGLSVYVMGESKTTWCHRTWTGQHVVPITGLVGEAQSRMRGAVDLKAQEEIAAALTALRKSRRHRRYVARLEEPAGRTLLQELEREGVKA